MVRLCVELNLQTKFWLPSFLYVTTWDKLSERSDHMCQITIINNNLVSFPSWNMFFLQFVMK